MFCSDYMMQRCKGTGIVLAVAYEEIAQALTTGKQCNIILRDVSKAFDTVWYDGLRARLLETSQPDPLCKLLSRFLSERQTRIKLENTVGGPFDIRSGVTQRSVISSTLFFIYTPHIPPPTHSSKSKNFMAVQTQRAIVPVDRFELAST